MEKLRLIEVQWGGGVPGLVRGRAWLHTGSNPEPGCWLLLSKVCFRAFSLTSLNALSPCSSWRDLCKLQPWSCTASAPNLPGVAQRLEIKPQLFSQAPSHSLCSLISCYRESPLTPLCCGHITAHSQQPKWGHALPPLGDFNSHYHLTAYIFSTWWTPTHPSIPSPNVTLWNTFLTSPRPN